MNCLKKKSFINNQSSKRKFLQITAMPTRDLCALNIRDARILFKCNKDASYLGR